MAVQVSASGNLEEIIGRLTEAERTQVPFALVLALNRAAAEAQAEVKAALPGKFTLRREWVAKGVRVKVATKRDMMARVYTKDWFMADQEEGRERHPTQAPTLFVPTLAVRQGGTLAGQIPRSMRPAALMRQVNAAGNGKRKGAGGNAKPKPFVATINGKTGLFIRRGPGRLPIVLLYTLKGAIKIPQRWSFEATTTGVADKVLRREFVKALDEALRTAKGGAIKSAYVSHLAAHGALDSYGGGSTASALPGSMLSALER